MANLTTYQIEICMFMCVCVGEIVRLSRFTFFIVEHKHLSKEKSAELEDFNRHMKSTNETKRSESMDQEMRKETQRLYVLSIHSMFTLVCYNHRRTTNTLKWCAWVHVYVHMYRNTHTHSTMLTQCSWVFIPIFPFVYDFRFIPFRSFFAFNLIERSACIQALINNTILSFMIIE